MKITLGVAMLLSLWGVGICADLQQTPTPTPQAKQSNQQPTNKEKEISLPAKPTPQIDQNKTDEFKTDKNNKTFSDLLIVWFTGALALFAFCQVVAMILQYRVMRIQTSSLRDTVEATKEAANAAKKSADAAELTAQAAIGAELPRFVVTGMVLRQGTDSPYATITLTNHGRTEAVITGECAIFQKRTSLPPNPRYPVSAQKLIDFGKTVKSGESHQIGVLLSPKDITDSMDGSNYFIIWGFGFIRYRDFLGENHVYGFVGGASIPSNSKGVITAIDGIHFQQQGPTAYAYNKYNNQ